MDITRDDVVLSGPAFPPVPSVPSVPSDRVIDERRGKTREFLRHPARGWLESAPSLPPPAAEWPSSLDPG